MGRRRRWRAESLNGHGEVKAWKRGENRLSSERNPLARRGPCSVCIPTAGMIVGAEEVHCSSRIFLSIEKRDGWKREEEKKARDRKRVRVWG